MKFLSFVFGLLKYDEATAKYKTVIKTVLLRNPLESPSYRKKLPVGVQ
jgi:hypothetical protein